MIISSNITAIKTNSHLASTDKLVQKSLERLSSGYKINSSEDDSVGKAISERMKLQIRGLDRASQNSADGISVIETADGALNEITSMLHRISELAVQGANSTYTDEDRDKIVLEVDSLKKEIDRISTDTQFNKKTLLNGELERKAYPLDNTGSLINGIDVIYVSNEVPANTYKIEVDAVGVASFSYDVAGDTVDFTNNAIMTKDGDIYTITDTNNFMMKFTLDTAKVSGPGEVNLEVTDIGAMTIQLGANEGQSLNICIPKISTDVLGISNLDFSTEDGCSSAITQIDKALTFVTRVRGELGANQNRLEFAVNSTDVSHENLTAALSRIIDVDMAEEMTTYTQNNVLQQAGVSMLSQANQMPEKVLQLLQ